MIAATSLTLLAVVALRWRGKQRRLPPLADAGLLATVRAMTSAHAPWFLLEQARRRPRGSRVFRLRVPLLQHWFEVADPDAVRLVFKASLDKPGLYADIDGGACGVPQMFTMKSSDPRWAHARKGVAHAFSSARIQRALLRGRGKLERVLQGLEELQGRPFDPAVLLAELLLEMLGASMLGGFDFGLAASAASYSASAGLEHAAPPALGREFISNLGRALPEYALRQIDPRRKHLLRLLPSALASRWFPLAAAADDAARRNMQIAQLILDRFRQRRDEASPEEREAMDETILGHLVNNDAYASERMRCADVQIFLVAGHDTTGYTLAWLLCELARCPERAARLRDDLARSQPAEAAPYLGACACTRRFAFGRSLRRAPCARLSSPHRARRRYVHTPSGSICHLPFLLLHRLADIPAPDEWRPERWLDGEGKLRTPEGLLPVAFSLGPRNCVGQALAMAELKRVTAALASRFVFEAVEPPTPDFFLTLKPSGARLRARRWSAE